MKLLLGARKGAFLLAVLVLGSPALALGEAELDLELDAYYSALGLTLPFTKDADSQDVDAGEMHTYRRMLSRALVPRYLVLEASVNPMPLFGVLVREAAPGVYADLQLSPELNLVEAVTAGFQEPYALSLFLGKVIDFEPELKHLGRSRKGYVGYLASTGNFHILNNLLVRDDWLELEWKFKGDISNDKRKMSWSFRFGGKLHENPEVLDVLHFGVRRNRVDFAPTDWGWLLNSAIEYRVDLSKNDGAPVTHFFLLEKNFPIRSKKWTLSLGFGYLWQGKDKYSGSLALKRRANESQFLLRPNLRF